MVRFLPKKSVLAIHDRQLRLYGGKPGILDEAKLDSALNHPKWLQRYSRATILEMAAGYGFHICKNHAFVKGNKRTASFAMLTFLQRNGFQITVTDMEAYEKMIAVADNKVSEQQLAQWLEAVTKPET